MTNNKQQTAVEWFFFECGKYGDTAQIPDSVIDEAKEMQKQRTVKLYNDYENYLEEAFKHQNGGQAVTLSFEEFYEQTYGGGEQ
jgi:hypothetical protein